MLIVGAYLFLSVTLHKNLGALASESVLDQYIEITDSRLDQLFRPIEREIRKSYYLIQNGHLRKYEPAKQAAILSSALLALPQCESVMMSSPSGSQFLVMNYNEDVYYSKLLDNIRNELPKPDSVSKRFITRDFRPSVWGTSSNWSLNEFNGSVVDMRWSVDMPEYDSKKRLWFLRAMEYLEKEYHQVELDSVIPVMWTDLYPLYTTRDLGMTAVISAITEEKDTVFIAYDLLVSDINKFTEAQDPTPNGGVFIFSDKSKLLGLPNLVYQNKNQENTSMLLHSPEVLNNPIINFIFSNWEKDNSYAGKPVRFTIEGETFWVRLKPYSVGVDKKLWTGVIIPESDLRMYSAGFNYLIYLVGFIGLLLALFISWRIASSISKPLTELVERNQRIASLDLGPGKEFKTKTTELYNLYLSIEKMRIALIKALDERRTAALHLEESESRYRELIQKNVAGVYRSTIQGQLIDCNNAFARIFGYANIEEIIDTPASAFYHSSFPRAAFMEALYKHDVLVNYEARYVSKKGILIHALLNVALVRNEEGEPMLIEGTIIDITDRVAALEALKKSETRLELALEGAGQAVWECDVQTGEGNFKNLAIDMLGYDVKDIPQNFKGWRSLVHPEDWEDIVSEVIIHLEGRSERIIMEHRMKDMNGVWRWIQTRGMVTEWNKDGVPLKATGTFIDISEKRKNENEKQKISMELMHYNSELEHFAYITSHNLRAPVVNLESLLAIYDFDKNDSQDNKLILHKISESVERLSGTISDLNDIVAIKKDKQERLSIVGLEEIFKATLVSIQSQIDKSNAQVRYDFSDAPEVLYVRSHMVSVFQNFLTNAIKYRKPDRDPIIAIRTYRDNGYICLSVKDNGIGIDLALYGNKLFELYQRFHTDYEGKGLGLYIVKAQVEMHGGHITVRSEVDKGTEFIVHFKDSIHGKN